MSIETANPVMSPFSPPIRAAIDFGGVEVTDEPTVRAYLAQYPEIVSWLPELVAETRKVFGPAAGLRFMINEDPEFYDPFLILRVAPPDLDPLLDRLLPLWDKLERLLENSQGWVSVLEDYRRPEKCRGV